MERSPSLEREDPDALSPIELCGMGVGGCLCVGGWGAVGGVVKQGEGRPAVGSEREREWVGVGVLSVLQLLCHLISQHMLTELEMMIVLV